MLPRTLCVIKERAFSGCKKLKSITFGENSELKEIQSEAFCGSGLESFTASASLKKIGNNAFMSCRALKHVDLSACTL